MDVRKKWVGHAKRGGKEFGGGKEGRLGKCLPLQNKHESGVFVIVRDLDRF